MKKAGDACGARMEGPSVNQCWGSVEFRLTSIAMAIIAAGYSHVAYMSPTARLRVLDGCRRAEVLQNRKVIRLCDRDQIAGEIEL